MSSKSAAGRGTAALAHTILRVLFPHAIKSSSELREFFPSARDQERLVRRLWEMKRRGEIKKSGEQYRITPKGLRRLTEQEVCDLSIPLPKKWDGKWRLVLFDIPTNRKKYRDILRLRLKELGLSLYQDSVWVYPFPVEDTLKKVAEFYFISKYVLYATTEQLSDQEKLQRHFHNLIASCK